MKNHWIPGLLASILSLIASAAVYGQSSTYNGTSIGSGGTIYAWGVTDVTNYGYMHTAYVSAKLTSPDGRVAYSGMQSAANFMRVDISLPWSDSDLGDYVLETRHTGVCQYMGAFINNLGLFLIARAGLSIACYSDSYTPGSNGPGWWVYTKQANCDVPCADADVVQIYIGAGEPPVTELLFFPYLRLGGSLLCSPAGLGGYVANCSCGFIEV